MTTCQFAELKPQKALLQRCTAKVWQVMLLVTAAVLPRNSFDLSVQLLFIWCLRWHLEHTMHKHYKVFVKDSTSLHSEWSKSQIFWQYFSINLKTFLWVGVREASVLLKQKKYNQNITFFPAAADKLHVLDPTNSEKPFAKAKAYSSLRGYADIVWNEKLN